MKKIFCMIIACSLIYTQAFGVTLLGSGVAAGGPDILIGSTIQTGSAYTVNPDTYYGFQFTALKTGAAGSGFWLSNITVSSRPTKMVVYTATGDLIGESEAVSSFTQGVIAEFSSWLTTPSFTVGQDYFIGIISSGYLNLLHNTDLTVGGVIERGGSYLSILDPLSLTEDWYVSDVCFYITE